jgi:hypothetical protein
MFGLSASAIGVTLDKAVFNCCDGQGIQMVMSSPRSASQCSLMRRWSRLSTFLSQIGLNPDDPNNVLFGQLCPDCGQKTTQLWNEGLQNFQLFCRDNLDGLLRYGRGRVVDLARYSRKLDVDTRGLQALSSETPVPRLALLAGAVLIWHFDICVLPFRMGHPRQNMTSSAANFSLVPVSSWDSLIDRSGVSHKLIIVDGVSELWHPNRLELMEALISYAAERRIPLWIFEDQPSNANQALNNSISDKSFRTGINKRLAGLRSRNTCDWITAQGRSRMSEVCDVGEVATKDAGIPTIV